MVDAAGTVLARGPQFREDLLVVDLDLAESTVNPASPPEGVVHVTLSDQPDRAVRRGAGTVRAPRLDPVGEVYEALTLGLGDYVRKNGFRSVLLGVSGGIDSTLVATIAADAIGGENVVGISIPEPLLQPALPRRRRGARRAPRPGLPRHPDRADGQRLPRQREAVRRRGGEPPGARARRWC